MRLQHKRTESATTRALFLCKKEVADIGWQEQALKIYIRGATWGEITDATEQYFPPDMPLEKRRNMVRDYIRWTKEYKARHAQQTQDDFERSSMEYKSDGSIISEKFITIRDGDEMTPEFILEAHGLKVSAWEVVSYKNNFWNTQIKGGAKQISYQSKLTARPAKEHISLDHIDEFFMGRKFNKPPTKALNYDPSGEVLEIDLPDIHSGLLAWRMESGADYDLHIMQERFYQCAYDITDRCKHKKLKKIIVATLGDLLHFDNDNQTTTKGTFQQADGRLSKIFDFTLEMLINFLTILGDIAPVEVIYMPGNHDRVVGYMLLKSLEMAFRSDDRFEFDTTPNPHKYRLVGCTLIGWTHGDMQKQNMPNWLQNQARKEYGESKYAEIHAGHFHSLTTKEVRRDFVQENEVGGVIVRYLPTICNASYWENQQGYTSAIKTMMCFLWNENTGLREMWYSNVA